MMTKNEAELFAVQKMIDGNLDVETIIRTMVALAMNGNELMKQKLKELFRAHRDFVHQDEHSDDYLAIRDGKLVWIEVPRDGKAKPGDIYKE